MPELPEVETLRRALLPLVENRILLDLKFFRKDLRFPIPRKTLKDQLPGHRISEIIRRGKYLLLKSETGALLVHLGMSGRMAQFPSMNPVEKHTHAAFRFEPDTCLHYIDPRRFGCLLWIPKNQGHPLIDHLGPDPLDPTVTARILKTKARHTKASIKSFLMDSRKLAGVGNIYACEALYGAAIRPRRAAGRLTLAEWERLLQALRDTLQKSISFGGTTLRDFFSTDGSAGYYTLELMVYGKEGQPCPRCGSPVTRITQIGRSTFFCKTCQQK